MLYTQLRSQNYDLLLNQSMKFICKICRPKMIHMELWIGVDTYKKFDVEI